jgi:hypothetical protein
MSLAQPFRRRLRRATRWVRPRLHPSRAVRERVVRGDLPPAETSRVLQHLLPGCERCSAVTASLWTIGTPTEGFPVEYEHAFERVFSAARRAMDELESGRCEAVRLAAELEGLPAERRWYLARNDPRYRSRALFELLLRRSRESMDDPRRAASLAELAVAVAEGLGAASGRPSLANEDLKAAAWGALAGARRLLPDFAGAEEALATARAHLARGTDDRLEKAWLLDLEASLRETQGRALEASRLRGRARALYRRVG